MFAVKKNVPKPADIPTRDSTTSKYPFPAMEVGDFFAVPYTEMIEGDTPQSFRNRVQKSAKNYGLRMRTETGQPRYTVALMPEDDKVNTPPEYSAGDVGVWRDE